MTSWGLQSPVLVRRLFKDRLCWSIVLSWFISKTYCGSIPPRQLLALQWGLFRSQNLEQGGLVVCSTQTPSLRLRILKAGQEFLKKSLKFWSRDCLASRYQWLQVQTNIRMLVCRQKDTIAWEIFLWLALSTFECPLGKNLHSTFAKGCCTKSSKGEFKSTILCFFRGQLDCWRKHAARLQI